MPMLAELLVVTLVAYIVGVALAYLIRMRRNSAEDRRW